MDLSIIVPVYNVEKYIRPCIESIFRQDLDENIFEVIIVNDGTKDLSMEMIADIIQQHNNITIINQENQGLSVARNNGIAAARGEYILMPDSDDLLIENSLKPLLKEAIESQVDILVADYFIMNDKEIESFRPSYSQLTNIEIKEKTGKQIILEELVSHECYVWRSLYKREFIIKNNLSFYPGITYQDRPFTYSCYLKANRCLRILWPYYIYRKGHSSAASYALNKKKAFDYCISIAEIWKLTKTEVLSTELQRKIKDNIKKNIAALFRRTVQEIDHRQTRFEIIDFLINKIPDFKKSNSLKDNIFTYFILNNPHTYISCLYIYINLYEKRIRPIFRSLIKCFYQ